MIMRTTSSSVNGAQEKNSATSYGLANKNIKG